MRIARIAWQDVPTWAILEQGEWHALKCKPWEGLDVGAALCREGEETCLAPIEPTNKVIGLGLTYKRMWQAYQRRQGAPHRDGPAAFMKPNNTIVAQGEPIVRPSVCQELIYEAEVGAVIGRRASRLTVDQALDHIMGYTCVNDVTCMRFRTVEQPIVSTRFKIGDTFCPIGPWIETQLNPEDITVVCRVNGVEVERSNTGADLCYSVAELVAWVTSFMTLEPGDIVATGSNGTGPIVPGDVVEVEIEHLGVLQNWVQAGA